MAMWAVSERLLRLSAATGLFLSLALAITPAQSQGWNDKITGFFSRDQEIDGLGPVDDNDDGGFLGKLGSGLNKAADSVGRAAVSVARFGQEMVSHGTLLMCEEDPYAERGIVQTMYLTSSYLGESLRNYKLGLQAAEEALFSRQAVTNDLMREVTTSNRQLGFAAGFNNFRALEQSDEVVNLFEQELLESQEIGFDEATQAKLIEANKSLYIANYYQLRTGLGIYHMYSYVRQMDDARDIRNMLETEGVNETFTALMSTPANLKTLADSFGNAIGLYGKLRRVTNFSTERSALDQLGIPAEIQSFEQAAIDQARATEQRYPNLVGARPTGGVLSDFMAEQPWAEDGQDALGPAFNQIMSGTAEVLCQIIHGDSISAANAGGSTGIDYQMDASAIEVDNRTPSREEVRVIQTLLNTKGFNAGTPDGIVGNKTRSALEAFRDAEGLPGGPTVNLVALEQLAAEQNPFRD